MLEEGQDQKDGTETRFVFTKADYKEHNDVCREHLRVELTKKIVHARSGDLLKRYTEIFKSQLKTLLDFRATLKATAAAAAPSKKAVMSKEAGGATRGDEQASD